MKKPSATSKTAQTVINKDGENVNGASRAGGARLARQGQPRDLDIGRNGQVWEHRQDGGISRAKTATGSGLKRNDRPGLRFQ
jgi:hypothetical protein